MQAEHQQPKQTDLPVWFVLYTKSRNEKIVAERLSQLGIEVYCPLIKTKRQWTDRVKTVEEPLFKSYVFVRLSERERAKVFEVQGVVRYLFWLKKAAIVRDEEIQAIQNLLDEHEHHLISVNEIGLNDRIRINSGTLADTAGQVTRMQGKKLYVRIESLQMTVVVDLSQTEVKRI